ncbi:hypothetical protein AGOR_G00189940 [Albula goreensis]|uniref:Histone-lysine N-methyltransferase NSD2 n=1 Tax=Albula goreensis TaxID=1534307 RepID=A0A8T3CQN8_9TELE|nr:hypothetical protein AGOR_G00189940 [Albula goreensis]
MSVDTVGSNGMDCKGCSLPMMPEPLNPVSMKQAPEPLGSRKNRADKSTDPALLMTGPAMLIDKAAAHLAVTLQDTVLQKMGGHSHERLKDLTSRVLNGEQDKPAKLCAAEGPLLKGADTPPPHTSPQRKSSSPELKLKITQLVSNSKPHFEPSHYSEDGECPDLPRTPSKARERKKKRKRTVKAGPKPKPRLPAVPEPSPVTTTPEDVVEAADEVCKQPEVQAVEVKEENPLQVRFHVGDVVWTKVSGYPWWPCMVTTDPGLNKHIKQKAVNSRSTLLYHVQYFGDTPERGYVFEKSMVSFEGMEQYQELCQGSAKQAPSRTDRRKAPSSVPLRLRAHWNTGVSQATQAASMGLEERLAKYTFTYTGERPELNLHVQRELGIGQEEKPKQGQKSSSPQPPDQMGPHTEPTDLSHTPPNGSTLQTKKTALKKTPGSVKRAARGKRPLRTKDKPKVSKSSKKKQVTQSVPQASPAVLPEGETLKPKPDAVSKPLKKSTQAMGSQAALPAVTGSAKKPGRSKSHRTKEKSDLKGKKKLGVQKRSYKRQLNATEEEQDVRPKKRMKVDGGSWKKKSDSTTTKEGKSKTKLSSEKKKKASETSQTSASETKPLKKRKRVSDTQSPTRVPRKRRVSAQEPEVCEQRAESPSDSTDETHAAKKGERNGTAAKKENVCQVCEGSGESLFPCEGQCCGTFHLDCLGLTCKPQGKLLCQECSSGQHSCFSCKQSDGELRRCMVQQCGKFYHEACARLNALSVFESKGFRCPLHTCLSCHYSIRSRLKASKGKMMRCVRCPVAYHTGDLCVAAGSEMLTPTAIICTNHFTAKKGYSHHSHVNVSWCFVCSKGGSLLCCESCPAAFHPDCLNIAMPDGSWYCNDCKAGKKPKYRDIIWVKLGNYRWWPAEIRHPRTIPSNIQHLRHEIGEFPVFFFGSKDYFWTHQARVFPYMEGDRGSKYQKTGIGKVFKNALLEAEARFREIKQEREAKEAQENDRKPPPYKYIKINKPFGRVQIYTADISEIPKCNCKPTDEKPCGFESECLNRMLMYECHPQVCPAGERCQNQGFTKRQYPDTKIIKTAGKGWGLLALRDIKKGEFVNEYVGELIDEVECRARIKYAQENDITHFYMLTIDKDRIIDAGPKGNYSRFMNHSCQPNCETQKWTVNGDTRVGLFALCDIPAGTELTFNYNLDCLGNEKTVCRCGAPNCSGFLGDRPKNSIQATEVKGKKIKKKQKKRRARNEGKKRSEDECFRCGDGGQLVLCDKKGCTKAYHLSCLDRTKRPFGRWDCPWHHCDVCGKNSEVFCQLCPNSFCKAHQEGALRIWAPTGQLCCQEHEDMELRPILDRREAEAPFIDGARVAKLHKRA